VKSGKGGIRSEKFKLKEELKYKKRIKE